VKVSGITFVRNAVKFDYPIVEAIQSILPICDEVIVLLGDSEDNTEALIRSIKDPKIKIILSVWDDSLREGGKVLAVETNKALDAVSPNSDWVFYLQGDEVLHEQYLEVVKNEMAAELQNTKVEGLLFKYLHFWGSYDYVADSRKWYQYEIRVIRNNPKIRSYKDAQGFRKVDDTKLAVKLTPAYIYHYGWVRPPEKQIKKRLSSNRFWHNDDWIKENLQLEGEYDYSQIDSVQRFKGSHPKVMEERVNTINWEFNPKPPRLSQKERLSRFIERLTGYRIGAYKNYRLLK
jgi:hypothetical protein